MTTGWAVLVEPDHTLALVFSACVERVTMVPDAARYLAGVLLEAAARAEARSPKGSYEATRTDPGSRDLTRAPRPRETRER